MKYIILTLLFLFLTATGFAQTSDGQSYTKAKLYLKDNSIITAKKLKISATEVTFYNHFTNESQKLELNKVNLVMIRKGSHLWDGAAYGALTGALTALLVDTDEDPFGRPNKVTVGEYVGATAGGAALGAIIGSFFPRWKQIYAKGAFLGHSLPLNLGFDTQYDKVVINITIPL